MTDNSTASTADQLALTTMDRDSWQKLADLVRERAEKAEAERDRYAELLAEASAALRAVGKAAIVVEPTLSTPYPDAPHTSPWQCFMKAPAKRAYNLGWQIHKELAGARRPSDQPARTTLDNPLTSTNTVDNPKEQP